MKVKGLKSILFTSLVLLMLTTGEFGDQEISISNGGRVADCFPKLVQPDKVTPGLASVTPAVVSKKVLESNW